MSTAACLALTLATVFACLAFSRCTTTLLQLSLSRSRHPAYLHTAVMVALTSGTTMVILLIEGVISDYLAAQVAQVFFYIATSTGLFVIFVVVYELFYGKCNPADVMQAGKATVISSAFGNMMILVANIIAFAQMGA